MEAYIAVSNGIGRAQAVVVSLDLWKSSGSKDVFSVVAYVCSSTHGLHSFHLVLVQMDQTDAMSIAVQLKSVLKDHSIDKR